MDAETVTMEGQELSAISMEGLHIMSFAVEPASVSQNNANRRLDEFFTVKLCYQDEWSPNERSSSFTLPKEIEGSWDVIQAVAKELDTLSVDIHVYDCVADVVAENCDILRQQVFDGGRTSLAMIVKIGVGERFTVHYEDLSEYDDIEEDDEEEEAVVVNSVEAKSSLSSNGGVRFISGDQISADVECCSICLEELQKREKNGDGKHDDVAVLPCFHVFHEDCLVPWIARGKKTCPFCRFNLLPC